MDITKLSDETKLLLIKHQLLSIEPYGPEDADEYVASIEALQNCADEDVRQLARRIDTKQDVSTIPEEEFQLQRDAQSELVRVSFQIQDTRSPEVKAQLN